LPVRRIAAARYHSCVLRYARPCRTGSRRPSPTRAAASGRSSPEPSGRWSSQRARCRNRRSSNCQRKLGPSPRQSVHTCMRSGGSSLPSRLTEHVVAHVAEGDGPPRKPDALDSTPPRAVQIPDHREHRDPCNMTDVTAPRNKRSNNKPLAGRPTTPKERVAHSQARPRQHGHLGSFRPLRARRPSLRHVGAPLRWLSVLWRAGVEALQ
jgi:hypothetical protein